MHQTFFQKVLLTVFSGFAAACLIWAFEHVFEDANSAVGNSVRNSTSVSH
jgi:hypothetical protein